MNWFFLQKSTCTHNSLRSKYTTTPFCTSFTWNMSPFNIDKGENRLRLTDVQTLLMHHHRERERERSGSIDLCYMTRETPVCVGAKRYVRAERIHIGPQSAPSFWAFFLPVIRAYYTCIYMQRVLSEDVILYISSRGESWDRWTKCIVTRGSESESLKGNSVFFFVFFFRICRWPLFRVGFFLNINFKTFFKYLYVLIYHSQMQNIIFKLLLSSFQLEVISIIATILMPNNNYIILIIYCKNKV